MDSHVIRERVTRVQVKHTTGWQVENGVVVPSNCSGNGQHLVVIVDVCNRTYRSFRHCRVMLVGDVRKRPQSKVLVSDSLFVVSQWVIQSMYRPIDRSINHRSITFLTFNQPINRPPIGRSIN